MLESKLPVSLTETPAKPITFVICVLIISTAIGCGTTGQLSPPPGLPLPPSSPATYAASFSATGNLHYGRYGHTAFLLPNGNVFILGGTDDTGSPVSTSEIYNLGTSNFVVGQSMLTGRLHFAAATVGGEILVTGGDDSGRATLQTTEFYDPQSGKFSPGPSMTAPRQSHSATSLTDGRVLIIGGMDDSNGIQTILDSAEIYDPKTGEFSPCGNMAVPRSGHTATELNDGTVLIVGGNVSGDPTEVVLFDPKTCTFKPIGWTKFPRSGHTATLLPNGNGVLVVGGAGQASSEAERYDLVSRTFLPVYGDFRGMNQTASLMPDGRVLLIGGADSNGAITTAKIYDLSRKEVVPTADMKIGRAMHTATLLQDGSVLVVGGTNGGSPPNALVSAEVYR